MTWRHTGHPEAIAEDALTRAVARFDDEVRSAMARRSHYFLALVGFVVSPPLVNDAVLDHENIRVAPSVGCFICEQPWTPDMPARCPGEPR